MNQNSLDHIVIIALGGNLPSLFGAPRDTLASAVRSLPAEGLPVISMSGWWRSTAWPDSSDPEYINAVVLVETTLDPTGVLAALHRIEASHGRTRSVSNAPRTLDLDLIAHGLTQVRTPELWLPHPRAADRLFVMGPLAEIAPQWRHPVDGRCAAELAAQATVGRDSSPLAS
jgi:2-amino-4-hydroxy-6-hydroxymethyldihydropteridine diphosphokinase